MAVTTDEDFRLYNQLRVLINILGVKAEVRRLNLDHWLIIMYSALKMEAVCPS
jgi:hypothetical protein